LSYPGNTPLAMDMCRFWRPAYPTVTGGASAENMLVFNTTDKVAFPPGVYLVRITGRKQ